MPDPQTIAATVGTIEEVRKFLDKDRSVTIEVDNNTSTTLKRVGDHHSHGGFATTPKSEIGPKAYDVYGSQDKGFMTGTEGTVKYDILGANARLVVKWNNPFIGSNSSGVSLEGTGKAAFKAVNTTGSGDTKAHMRFELFYAWAHDVEATYIDAKYQELIQSNPWIGQPVSGGVCADGAGSYRHYAGGASIFWHPQTGAHLIYGLIHDKYAALGWERSPVGYPTTDEADAGSGWGRYNGFQHGSIVWKSGTNEAFAVYGAIALKWGEQDWDRGFLGFPLTDETGTPDQVGRFNHFEGGSIYWTPQTGAHFVIGVIRQVWADQGWETGKLGYPVTDELVTDGTDGKGRHSGFQGGVIYWTPDAGTTIQYY